MTTPEQRPDLTPGQRIELDGGWRQPDGFNQDGVKTAVTDDEIDAAIAPIIRDWYEWNRESYWARHRIGLDRNHRKWLGPGDDLFIIELLYAVRQAKKACLAGGKALLESGGA